MSEFVCFQLSDPHIQFCAVLIWCILLHHGMHFIFDVIFKLHSRFAGHQGQRWDSDGSCACAYVRHYLCMSAFAAKTSLPFTQTEHCHLCPYTPTHSSIHWKPCSVFSSQVRSYFNPPTFHPDNLSSYTSLSIYILLKVNTCVFIPWLSSTGGPSH